MKSSSRKGRVVLSIVSMLAGGVLAVASPAAAATNTVSKVEVTPSGALYIHFANGTGCTGNGYIVNAGGSAADNVVSVALASMLSGRAVDVVLSSTTPPAGGTRCLLGSLSLL